MAQVTPRLDLNRTNLIVTSNQKNDCLVLTARPIRERVIKKFVTARRQHLRHDIFVQVTETFGCLIVQYFLIQGVFRERLVFKH